MPSAAPFDNLEDVANTSRVRLNDAIQSLGGDILTDNNVFTLTFITAAWRRFQQLLCNFNASIFKRQAVYSSTLGTNSIPASTSTDYGAQSWMNWDNFFTGSGSLLTSPVLPTDLINPLEIWERVQGSTGPFYKCDEEKNGLPWVPKQTLNRAWEWRNNTLYLIGATGVTDIQFRYQGYLADFVANTTTPFSSQPVPVVNCLSPFAWFLCAEVAKSRGDMDAGSFEQNAIGETKFIFDRDQTQGKSIYKRSELGKMVDWDTPLEGPEGPRGLQSASAKGAS